MLEQHGYAMIGQTISHFSIEEQIGAGGMGVVYRARDERLDREVALKVLSPALVHDRSFLERFRREARLLSKLNHPNIATIHDFDTIDGTSFLVMELIQGETLNRKVADGPLPESEIVRLASQLLQGLQAAHDAGIIHRDLKPSNLRETPDGRVKILDFGLARIAQADLETTQSTATAGVVGTLPYMSPEQLRGESVDARTDIYSAGVVLYELATGQRPFNETLAPRLIDSILHRPATSPREFNPQISPALEHIILKALEKLPRRRYQTAREMLAAVECLTTGSTAQPTVAQGSAFTEKSEAPPMEIAHVLFTDIVGYSKLPMDEQQRQLRRLQKLVRETPAFERARSMEQLISLPTGDGMALAFFGDPELPVRCALELSTALRSQPEIKLRMGINSGPVYRVADINANRNVAGGGINIAQRVMDCGDAGHILVSKAVADVLSQLSIWQGRLEDLGEVEVKHGVLVHIFNLHTEEGGNPALPEKVRKKSAVVRAPAVRWKTYVVGLAVLAVLVLAVVAGYFIKQHAAVTHPEPPRKSVAVLAFKNDGGAAEEWMGNALPDMMNTQLDAGMGLRIVSGEDVFHATSDLEVPRMASYAKPTIEKLHAILKSDYILAGSYFASGNSKSDSIHMDLHLQDSTSGDVISDFPLDGTVGGMVDLLKQVASRVRAKLQISNPKDAEIAQSSAALSENPEATRLYSEGRAKLRKFDALGATDLLQQAVDTDPNWALPHAALSEAWQLRGYDSKAKGEAEKALNLSSSLSDVDKRSLEGRYGELNSDRTEAIKVYSDLSGVFKDDPDYALDLARVQTSADKGTDALATLDALEKMPGMTDDPRVNLARAYAAESLSDRKLEQTSSAAAADKASALGSRYLAAQAYWQECSALYFLGELDKAMTACHQSLDSAPFESVIDARTKAVEADIMLQKGDAAAAREMRLQDLDIARKLGSQVDVIGALQNLANLAYMQGDPKTADSYFNEAMHIAETTDNKRGRLGLENDYAGDLYAAGDFAGAENLYRKSLATAQQINDSQGAAMALENLGLVLMMRGDLAGAKSEIGQAIVIQRPGGFQSDLAGSLGDLGDLLLTQNDLAGARKAYDESLKIFTNIQSPGGVASTKSSLAELALAEGKPADAVNFASQAADALQEQKFWDPEAGALTTLAKAYLAQGKIQEAQSAVDRAKKLNSQDHATQLLLDATAAVVKARAGDASVAKRGLDASLAQAQKLKLVGVALEISLAKAEVMAPSDPKSASALLKSIEADAKSKGYLRLAADAGKPL